MERALQHQIRHEYNKTGRHSNVTNIEDDHVTIVLDLIQVKVESADSHAVQWTCRETGTEVYWNGATRGHMSPLAITRLSQPLCAGPSGPGGVEMRLSAYFGKRLHGMLSWTHVHA